MKISLCLLLLLSMLSCAGVTAIHFRTNAQKDQVIITETTLYGDPVHAEGAAADSFIECAHHLFWNSRISLGDSPLAETDFRFHSLSPSLYETDPYQMSLYTTGNHFGSSSNAGFDFDNDHFFGVSELLKDVASRSDGESYTETVRFKDYYDFYPVNISMDFNRFHYHTDAPTQSAQKLALDEAFGNFFKIPVLEDYHVTVEMNKNRQGVIHSVNMRPAKDGDDYFMNLSGVRDSSRIFITLDPYAADGRRMDTSHIPGGYGIYSLPYTDIPTQEVTLQADKLEVCYPLDDDVRVLELAFSPDRSHLLLTTREDNIFYLTVIDPTSMATLQKLEFASSDNPDVSYSNHRYYDDFILLHSGYAEQPARLIVLAREANGLYRVALTTNRDPDGEFEEPYFAFYCVNAAWDGRRLIMANYDLTNARGSLCRFYVRVYDQNGVRYIGQYDSTLDTSAMNYYRYPCEPVNREALAIHINP